MIKIPAANLKLENAGTVFVNMSLFLHKYPNLFFIKTLSFFSFLFRRMFPAMRVKISGLDPHQQYYIAMDIVPVDNKRYRYSNCDLENLGYWEVEKSMASLEINRRLCLSLLNSYLHLTA